MIRSAIAPLALAALLAATSLSAGAAPSRRGPVATPTPAPGVYDPMHSFAPLVEAIAPAVVKIEVRSEIRDQELPAMFRDFFGEHLAPGLPRTRRGEGSGFVISADGKLLTNAHVVEGADEIVAVFQDGTEVPATVLGRDRAMDVALLRLEGDREWPWVELGSSADLRVGDWVLAVGNPLGLGHTVTAGIVSGKGRVLGHDVFGNEDFIQTDAAINQGNSGGPLFDVHGRVVGIATAIVAGANTVGFAIPVDLVEGVLDDLETRGKVDRGYLGVRPQRLDAALATALRVPGTEGALVSQVFEGTPAERSGIQQGDVIVRVDDAEIEDPEDLVGAIGNRRPGEAVEVAVLRDGHERRIRLVLGDRPGDDEPAGAASGAEADVGDLGVGLRELSPAVAAETGATTGVLVERVLRGSPADGRLRAGDVIVEVNRRPVATPDEVEAIVRASRGRVTLLVLRDRAQHFVVIGY